MENRSSLQVSNRSNAFTVNEDWNVDLRLLLVPILFWLFKLLDLACTVFAIKTWNIHVVIFTNNRTYRYRNLMYHMDNFDTQIV